MRRSLARLLRSVAYRLDPPRPVTTDPGEGVFWDLGEFARQDELLRRRELYRRSG